MTIFFFVTKKMVTKKTLNEIAKQKGIKGYSKMRKAELEELLENLPEEEEEPYKIQASKHWKEEEKEKKT